MNTEQPLSVARVTWLVARLTLRRQLNILQRIRFSRAKTGAGARSGTATKAGGRSILAAILFPLMVVNGLLLGSRALTNLSAACRNVSEASDKIIVSRYTMSQLGPICQRLAGTLARRPTRLLSAATQCRNSFWSNARWTS